MATVAAAQRKIDAIDARIDAVRAELYRAAGINPDAFDYDTEEGQMVACHAFHNARRDVPGYDGIEQSLFIRRGVAVDARDTLIAKERRAAERRELRAFREANKRWLASRHSCPTCGIEHSAA